MRQNKYWMVWLLVGVILLSAACYFTLRKTTRQQYADGQFVTIDIPWFSTVAEESVVHPSVLLLLQENREACQ